MIIVDLNQTVIANVMMGLSKKGPVDIEVNEDLLAHMIIKSLLTIFKKFKKEYGRMVIAGDGPNVWRKQAFPYYKAKRRESASLIDWKVIFAALDSIRSDLIEFLPWPTVHIEGVEGDDIIAKLTREATANREKVVIVSGDNDFIQLHSLGDVQQWDHINKRFLSGDPEVHLMTKIIRGDTGDGVPNFLSDDDTLVTSGKRQKSITAKMMLSWAGKKRDEICTEEWMKRNWDRNVKLIDLSQTPDDLQEQIMHKYREQLEKRVTLDQITHYLIQRRMKTLMQDVQDFK